MCPGLRFKVRGSSDCLLVPLSSSGRRMVEHADPGAHHCPVKSFLGASSLEHHSATFERLIFTHYLQVFTSTSWLSAYSLCLTAPSRRRHCSHQGNQYGFPALSLAGIFNPSSFFPSATFSAVDHFVRNYSVSSFWCLGHDTPDFPLHLHCSSVSFEGHCSLLGC